MPRTTLKQKTCCLLAATLLPTLSNFSEEATQETFKGAPEKALAPPNSLSKASLPTSPRIDYSKIWAVYYNKETTELPQKEYSHRIARDIHSAIFKHITRENLKFRDGQVVANYQLQLLLKMEIARIGKGMSVLFRPNNFTNQEVDQLELISIQGQQDSVIAASRGVRMEVGTATALTITLHSKSSPLKIEIQLKNNDFLIPSARSSSLKISYDDQVIIFGAGREDQVTRKVFYHKKWVG